MLCGFKPLAYEIIANILLISYKAERKIPISSHDIINTFFRIKFCIKQSLIKYNSLTPKQNEFKWIFFLFFPLFCGFYQE